MLESSPFRCSGFEVSGNPISRSVLVFTASTFVFSPSTLACSGQVDNRILEELWGDEAAGKQNALWVYVSRLRSVLEPARSDSHESTVLVTRDHGYSLLVDSERVDAAQFEARVAEGRASLKAEPEAAGTLLREALDQWRGSALEDFTYEEFAQTEIARLEELHVGATEDRFEADLRSGKAGELVAGCCGRLLVSILFFDLSLK